MRLSRQGYGTIEHIKQMSVDELMDLIHYENYLGKYQESYRQLNRKK